MTPNEVVASTVVELRRRFGMTQRDVVDAMAERAGVKMDPATMARLEAGDRRITVNDVFAIAVALGVSPLHILLPRPAQGELEVGDVAVPFRDARAWLRAETSLDEADAARFRDATLPDVELRRRADELRQFREASRELIAFSEDSARKNVEADLPEVAAMTQRAAARMKSELLQIERDLAEVEATIEREGW